MLCGYMSSDMKKVTNFKGDVVLSQRVIIRAKWKTPKSFVSSEYYQVKVLIDGIWYTGRTAGENMSVLLKPCKSK